MQPIDCLALIAACLLCVHNAQAFSPGLALRTGGKDIPSVAARHLVPSVYHCHARTRQEQLGRRWSARSMTSSVFGFGENFFGDEKFSIPDLDESWLKLNRIFVLIFNPRSDNEGIYTLQVRAKDGKLINTVVFFEEEEDAIRYAGLLEAQDFPSPHIEPLDPREIKGFADDSGYLTTFIRAGTLFFPPEAVKDPRELLWERTGRVRVSIEEEEVWQGLTKEAGAKQQKQEEEEEEEKDGIDYDAMRNRLEALYGKDHM